MKKVFYMLVAGLSLELNASEVKDPLQEISKEEDSHMNEIAAVQTERIEQSRAQEEIKFVTVKNTFSGQVWVSDGYYLEDRGEKKVWVDTSHWETIYREEVFAVPSEKVVTLKAIDEKSGEKNSIVEEK